MHGCSAKNTEKLIFPALPQIFCAHTECKIHLIPCYMFSVHFLIVLSDEGTLCICDIWNKWHICSFFPLEYLLNSTPTFLESRYQTHPHAVLYAFSTALENPQSVDSLTENDFHQRNSRDKQIILRNHSMFY